MRKVNIMVDVSDEVYDSVVAPYKKSRGFSKLINSLLIGYLKDDYVAAYVDGTLDALKGKSYEAFDEAIASMNNSFATVGMLADSAESMMQEGINAVKVGGKKHNEEVSEDDMDVLIEDTNLKEATNQVEEREEVKKDESSDLREEMQALKLQNEEMNKNFKAIMEMMKSMGMATKGMDTNAFAESSNPEETESEKDEVAVTSEGEVHQEYAEETVTHKASASERKVSPVVETSSVPVEEKKHDESEVLDEDDPLAGDITFGDEDTEVPLFDMDDEEEEDDSDEDFLSGLLQGQVMSV